ncbi:MAG: hypothetical protein IJ150_07310 [Bacteroidales bacterium]|nr:hypothetical protein [Bacteroidales bacterium]
MEKVLENRYWLTAEENNQAMEEGYKYFVRGDFETLDSTDPWSGMPNVKKNIHLFDNKENAEKYAEKQTWPFNDEIHGEVIELERLETKAEREEREAKEKAEKEARKLARDTAKAEAEGMTVEEWRAEQKRLAKIKKVEAEIKELETEINRKKSYLEKIKK